MHRQQFLNCLYFNDYRVIHQQVESVAVIQLEFRRKRLAQPVQRNFQACGPQLVDSGRFVHTFEQSWSKF